jgi:hypothetical protein
LRIHLCSNLLQHFGTEQRTQDDDSSISLHAEVRWYGTGDLRTRSDIVLVEVSNLDVLRHNKMPSKGYGFNIPKGIIELKFRRPNGKSKSSFLAEIQDDLSGGARLLTSQCLRTDTIFYFRLARTLAHQKGSGAGAGVLSRRRRKESLIKMSLVTSTPTKAQNSSTAPGIIAKSFKNSLFRPFFS